MDRRWLETGILLIAIVCMLFGCFEGETTTPGAIGIEDGPKSDGAAFVDHDALMVVVNVGDNLSPLPSSMGISTDAAPRESLLGEQIMLEVPYISQFATGYTRPEDAGQNYLSNVNCGPASYLMVRAYYRGQRLDKTNAKENLENIIDWMDSDIPGYDPPSHSGVPRYCGAYTNDAQMRQLIEEDGDFQTEEMKVFSADGLRSELAQGHPVLVVVSNQAGNNSMLGEINSGKYSHWMVVVGIDKDYVYVNDPGRDWANEAYAHRRGFTIRSFMDEWKRWKNIGFRVSNRVDRFSVAIDDSSLSKCPTLCVGSPYSAVLAAVDGNPPYLWSITRGALPPGLTLSTDGHITGTPEQAGTFGFRVTVRDSSGVRAERDSSIYVSSGCSGSEFIITTAKGLQSARVGGDYQVSMAASGGQLPYRWSVIGGVLPAGLNLSPAGILQGAPAAQGNYTFLARVSDSSPQLKSGEKEFTLLVASDVTVAPTVAQSPMTAKQGTTVSQWGTGFTANSMATLHFRKPDGTEFTPLAQAIKADGSFSLSYTIPSDRPAGTYTWWGVDSTGKSNNTVSYIII